MGLLQDLVIRIRGDKSQLDAALTGAKASVNSFGTTVKKIAGLLGVAFGVNAIVNFTKELIKLTASAEGVKKGFNQIATAGLLDDLRKSTRNTVSDLQLMSRAVQASNFQIPLESLAKLLEFASARAVQTGQSVDYLVDSIVLGIGRKSPLILDNLGISAVRLRQLLKGPGIEMTTVGDIAKAVGMIATEELDKMGGMAETAGVKIQQLSTKWENLKETLGEFLNNSKAVGGTIQWATTMIEIFANKDLSLWQKLNAHPEEYRAWKDRVEEAKKVFGFFGDLKGAGEWKAPWSGIGKGIIDTTQTIADLKAALKAGEEALDGFKITEIDLIAAQQKTNAGLRAQIETLTKIPQTAKEAAEALEKLKEKYKAFWAETGQLGGLPQNNKTSSVFGGKTFGTAAPLSTKLAGAPGMPDPTEVKAMGDAFQKSLDTDAALKKIEDFQERLKEALTELQFMAVDLGVQIAESLGQALGGGDTKELGKGLLLSFANFLSQFGKMLIGVGLGLEAFQASIKTMNPVLALAAGAALLLAAGAIKGLMSKGMSGSGSSGGGGYSSGGGSHASAQAGKQVIVVEGTIKGKDIFISNRRYIEENG